MKLKVQKAIPILAALFLGFFVFFAPAESMALTSEQQIKISQAKPSTGDLENTIDKGVVQCGNAENIKDGKFTTPTDDCTLLDLFDTGIRVINAMMLAAAVFAMIKITIAGATMILSAGNEERLTSGKTGLTNALLGLVIVIIAYLLINTILSFLVAEGGGTGILSNPIDFIK